MPDGEPRVFEDPDKPGKYRAYIIGSHDLRVTSYCGPDIRAWSAPVEDLTSWRDEGPIFTYQIDGQWDVMFAPDLVEVKRKNGKKEYYLYPQAAGLTGKPWCAREAALKGLLSIRNLKVIDSPTIQLFSEILRGVGRNRLDGARKKGGIKVHALMDAFSGVTEFVRMTEAREHDRRFLYHLKLAPIVGWCLTKPIRYISNL